MLNSFQCQRLSVLTRVRVSLKKKEQKKRFNRYKFKSFFVNFSFDDYSLIGGYWKCYKDSWRIFLGKKTFSVSTFPRPFEEKLSGFRVAHHKSRYIATEQVLTLSILKSSRERSVSVAQIKTYCPIKPIYTSLFPYIAFAILHKTSTSLNSESSSHLSAFQKKSRWVSPRNAGSFQPTTPLPRVF